MVTGVKPVTYIIKKIKEGGKMADKKMLGIDFSSLFPSETFKITDECSVEIRPLSLVQFASVSKQLKSFVENIKEKGVTLETFNTPGNILEIASTALTQFPDILEEASGIDKGDLQQLPLEIIVNLIDVIITVNLKSKDKLLGNWRSLAGKIPLMGNMTQKKVSQKPSKS